MPCWGLQSVLTPPFRAELPEYILDFGYVVPGDIHTHIVKITNTGHLPASFHADRYVLYNTGNQWWRGFTGT